MRRSLVRDDPRLVLKDEDSTDTLVVMRTNAGDPYRELVRVQFETSA